MNQRFFHITKTGFTIIEILVAMGILGTVVAVGSGILVSILKGATKARILQEVKQNGNYTLTIMERMIRNARSVDSYGTDFVRITSPDGNYTVFRCCGSPTMIASQSATKLTCDNNTRLTNENVRVGSCTNFITYTAGAPPLVTVNFTLTQASTTPLGPEEQASVDFRTTISPRNY